MTQHQLHPRNSDGPPPSPRPAVIRSWISGRYQRATFAMLTVLFLSAGCWAQASDEIPLHEREPFDRITLDEKNNSAIVDVFPIPELQIRVPNSLRGRQFTIRRIQDPPDVRYTVAGQAIAKYERFQDLLLMGADRAIRNNQLSEAFQLLARVNQVAPDAAGLKSAEEAFFFADTRQLFRQRRYDESLLSLEQVFQRNPQRSGLDRALKNILSQILITEFAAENYDSVRAKLDFARRKYGTIAGPLIEQWEAELTKRAEEQLAFAEQQFAAGNASQALTALRRAADTWPDTQGISELRQQILARHPRLRVGVSQAFRRLDRPHSAAFLLNWATRRSSPLVTRQVRALEEYTVDGARYVSDLGQIKIEPDRSSLSLQLIPELAGSGHRIVQQLLRLADPSQEGFSPRWAEYAQDLYLDRDTIRVRLARPNLRPDGLLPSTLPRPEVADLVQHRFKSRQLDESNTVSYLRTEGTAANAISELTETVFSDPTEACDALLESRLDLVDRIHPADYDRLSTSSEIRLVPYRLPTIHGLVCGDRQTILRNATFRRGLLYGINRATFLQQELASSKKQTARLLSGFAPIGRSDNDPLGYAYNPDIQPRAYDPSLALVLMRLALRTQKVPEKTKSDEPEDGAVAPNALPDLTLAYPDSHVAIAACEFIASNWRRLGIKVTLRPLQSGQGWPEDEDWDVLYVETTIEEPLVDLPELILAHQILGRHGGLVWHSMRQLQDATSLEEVRDEFAKIHRLTYDHTPLLPLWQIIEHAAVRTGFGGLRDSPTSLYDEIDRWSLLR